MGNTLDYYNDDMSRKAVGKLFDNLDELAPEGEEPAAGQDTSSIVVGYDDGPADGKRAPREPVVEPPPAEPPRDPAMERALERAAELAQGGAKAPREAEPERAPEPERHARGRVFAEEGYDMGMYRRGTQEALVNDEEYEELMRPRRRARAAERSEQGRGDMPEPAVIRRAEPREGTETTPRRKRRADADEYIERSHARREREDTARAASAQRRVRSLMPYIMGIFAVLVFALIVLLFQVAKLNSDLAEAAAKETELNQTIQAQGETALRNEALSTEVADLTARLEQLQAQASPADPENPDGTGDAQGQPDAQGPALPATYVVVEGDNLSKISTRFYGSPGFYENIKAANGMTTDTVQVGQSLSIPEL